VLAPTNRAQIFRRLFSFSRLGKEFVNLAIEDAGDFSERVDPNVDLLPLDLRDRDALQVCFS
jgi:hypothetical protein